MLNFYMHDCFQIANKLWHVCGKIKFPTDDKKITQTHSLKKIGGKGKNADMNLESFKNTFFFSTYLK